MTVYCQGKKGFCDGKRWCITCSYYDGTGVKKMPTNADRIRAKDDEGMARFFYGLLANNSNRKLTVKQWLEWLNQPAEEDEV